MALFVAVLLLEVFEHFSHKVTLMSEHNTSTRPADLSTLLHLQNMLTEVITNHPEETEAASSTRAERHKEFSKIITKLETNNQAHLSRVGELENLLEASQALPLATRAVLQIRFMQLTDELGSHGCLLDRWVLILVHTLHLAIHRPNKTMSAPSGKAKRGLSI